MTKKKNNLIFIILFAIILLLISAIFVLSSKYRKIASYPLYYEEYVSKYSAQFSVPMEVIFAVIKTESNFNAEATSNAGAKGLMQLMPETFEWLSGKLGEKHSPEMISDIETNIRYGTYFLSYLFERFDTNETVFAAYNAGQGRVSSWLKDSRYSTDGKTLFNIPYTETKRYVAKASEAAKAYKEIIYKDERNAK